MESHECVITDVKTCTRCGVTKPRSDFIKGRCRDCRNARSREYYKANAEKICKKTAEYKANNPEKVKAMMADWYVRNRDHALQRAAEYRSSEDIKAKEKARSDAYYAARKDEIQAKRKKKLESDADRKARFIAYQERYYQENKHLYYERYCRRKRAMKVACPAWANMDAIKAIYKRSIEISKATGIKHVVDHIIPLKHKLVCGLHVEANLQIITEMENWNKCNKFTG